ncbi:TfoX/Sxy family protein [Paenibacillus sp.]|uniref:TfoX/Sxy family protein n=1 Tax=Paenibacillus sp. TaxID=58172 RepID=UPI002D58B072|nr:TfoX/Sxy family protein [Paenibacillus sp.]HZG56244.1 TfoX/Sxy family protein [Paenibacillus sp.]
MIGANGKRIRNMGDVGARWLASVGITTLEELAAVGSVEAYWRIREKHDGVNIVALYAMEGALLDMHWNELPPEVKDALHEQVGYRPKTKRTKVGSRPDGTSRM